MLRIPLIAATFVALFASISRSEKEILPLTRPFDGGTQFIYFPGNISGSFVHNTTRYTATVPLSNQTTINACGENGTYYFSTSGYMRIGASPPWDSNPFYFDLNRDEDMLHWATIWQLFFASANYGCLAPNATSGVLSGCKGIQEKPYYYVASEQLNLTKASISVEKEQFYPWEPLYSVKGDDSTWVGNGTADWNSLDFQIPLNYSLYQDPDLDCLEDLHVTWNNDTTFTYALNFTNTNATSSFVLTVPEGILTMSFSGLRRDTPASSSRDPAAAPDPHDYRKPYERVVLQDPAGYALPNFTYANGTSFHWVKDEKQLWHAQASGAVPSHVRGGRAVGAVVVLIMGLFLLS